MKLLSTIVFIAFTSSAMAGNFQHNVTSQSAVNSNVQIGNGNINTSKIVQQQKQANVGHTTPNIPALPQVNRQGNAALQAAQNSNVQIGTGNVNVSEIVQKGLQGNFRH